jgi:uncharacterized protein (DUF3084 family)
MTSVKITAGEQKNLEVVSLGTNVHDAFIRQSGSGVRVLTGRRTAFESVRNTRMAFRMPADRAAGRLGRAEGCSRRAPLSITNLTSPFSG